MNIIIQFNIGTKIIIIDYDMTIGKKGCSTVIESIILKNLVRVLMLFNESYSNSQNTEIKYETIIEITNKIPRIMLLSL